MPDLGTVMLVSTASSIGGMERIVCGLSRSLTLLGHRVRTFFPDDGNSAALLNWCAEQGVEAEVHASIKDAAAPHSLATARALRSLIDEVKPDTVNIHYGDNFLSLWDVLGARAARTKPKVVTSIHHPSPWEESGRKKRMMTALGARLVHGVTTFSHATRSILVAASIPERRLELIPCGIAVPADPPSRAEGRRLLGIPEDAFVVSSLARLVPHKGIEQLIEAMDTSEMEGALLLVGGEGPLRSELERVAAARRGLSARFLGRLPEVDSLFAASDVFALPSRLEGFGLVYVEAAMHSVPSVATRVGGVPDAVVDDQTGVLVELDDIDGLRKALVRLRHDQALRERMGRAARERAMSELNEMTMARRFAALFARL